MRYTKIDGKVVQLPEREGFPRLLDLQRDFYDIKKEDLTDKDKEYLKERDSLGEKI